MRERLTRKEFIKYWVSAGLFLVGCDFPLKPGEGIAESSLTMESEWIRKTPLQRISDLEFKRSPFQNQDEIKTQVISAVADFYCESMQGIARCKKTPDQLKQNVSFLDRDEFLKIKLEEFASENNKPPQRVSLRE